MKIVNKIILAVLATGVAHSAFAQNIDTTAPYTGSWSPIGVPDTSTYGQTFTVGTETTLQSFSFYLDGGSTFDYKAYVYQWDGGKATGSALYQSALTAYAPVAAGSPAAQTFSTGGLNLVSGTQYVAFLSTAGVQAGQPTGTALMPYSGGFGSDPYAGGDFVYYNTGDNFALLTSNNWDMSGGNGDVWFKADFGVGNAVPEPATWALMIGGFALAGTQMRRRKSAISVA